MTDDAEADNLEAGCVREQLVMVVAVWARCYRLFNVNLTPPGVST